MSAAVEAGLPAPETRDTEPPSGPSPADLFELPSPRAALRVPAVALPDLSLSMALRLLAHAATVGNGIDIQHFPGTENPDRPWFCVRLRATGAHGLSRYHTGYGPIEEAAAEAFASLENSALAFPGGLVDVSGFRTDDAPTETTLSAPKENDEVSW